jgi:hypothetical protein
MKRFFFGAIWSGSLVGCSLSGAALAQGLTRGSVAGWEMLRLGAEAYLLLPVLLICFLYRCSAT